MYVPVPGFCRSPILYLQWQRHPQQVETQPLLTTQSLHTMMLGASWSHIYREYRLLAETFEHCELDSMFLLCISTFYSITYSNCRLDQTRENSGTLNTTSYCHILQQCDLLDKRLFMCVYIYIYIIHICVCVRLTVRICWRKLKHVLLSLVFSSDSSIFKMHKRVESDHSAELETGTCSKTWKGKLGISDENIGFQCRSVLSYDCRN